MTARILVVDDEQNAREALTTILREEGYDVSEAADGEAGLEAVRQTNPDAVLCDIKMPKMDGLELLKRTRAEGSDTLFVMVTAFGSIETAVEAMRAGAHDYITKPVDVNAVLVKLEKVLETRTLRRDNQLLRERLHEKHRFSNIIGESGELQAVFDVVKRAAPTKATVLVLGESGTGKELIAQALHEESPRRDKPFVKVNCAALSESLLESELLRVLQQKEFERVGGSQTLKVDVRIVAATNRDLGAEVKAGRFREDLYYRLNVVSVTLPPLRQRKADIPALVSHFIEKYDEVHGKAVKGLAPGTLNALLSYDWPGNVRELSNVVERAVVLAREAELTSDDLPAAMRGPRPKDRGADTLIPGASLYEIEREAILKTLEMVEGSTSRAAEVLNISVRKIQYRLKEYAAHDAGAPVPPREDE